MAEQKRENEPEAPDWTVLGVYNDDADAEGLDAFSYTIGLHERGLPELLIWSGPSLGDDPGSDWRLSYLDRGHTLNRLARKMIDGDLHPGMTWTELMDFGLATATFTTGELVTPDEVEACMAAPSAKVMPIRFALHRDPLRDPGEVDAVAAAEIQQWTADVVEALTHGRGPRPVARALPGQPYDTSLGQQFGPATALLTALRAAVEAAGPTELDRLVILSITMDMDGHRSAEQVNAATWAFARAVGLQTQCQAAHSLAHRDAARASRRPSVRRAMAAFLGESHTTKAGRDAIGILTRRLAVILSSLYTAAVVVDVLPTELCHSAFAPPLTALTRGSVQRLWFGDDLRAEVRREMADLSPTVLRAIFSVLGLFDEERISLHVAAFMNSGDSPPADVLLAGTATLRAVEVMTRGHPLLRRGADAFLEDVARAVANPGLPASRLIGGVFEAALRRGSDGRAG